MATRLSRLVYRSELADPISGFFMLRRELPEDTVRLMSGQGFEILLEILARRRGRCASRSCPTPSGSAATAKASATRVPAPRERGKTPLARIARKRQGQGLSRVFLSLGWSRRPMTSRAFLGGPRVLRTCRELAAVGLDRSVAGC